MTLLIVGLILFFGMHLIPTAPALHSTFKDKLGEKPYKGIASLAALVGLILIVIGTGQAPTIVIWEPPHWTRFLSPVLILPAFIFLVAAYAPSNIKRFTRHPMLWAVTLWAAAHLATNGDLTSMVLFGAFLLYSLFDMVSANRRGALKATVAQPFTRELVVIVIGVVLYGLFVYFHADLFGVPAMMHSAPAAN